MKSQVLKSVLALSCGLVAVATAYAAPGAEKLKPFADADHVIYAPTKFDAAPAHEVANITNHGGGVIVSAKVVFIFWGPNFNNAASADFTVRPDAAGLPQPVRHHRRVQHHHAVLRHPARRTSARERPTGSTPRRRRPTSPTPPSSAEVNRYFSGGHGAFNTSTIYEVVIPSTSYSSSGSSTSCGGPSLAYCAYHGSYSGASGTVKYSIEPYPSCSGCKVSGWSDVQNAGALRLPRDPRGRDRSA